MFYCAAPLSGAFGGLLATGLAEIRYNGYNRKARHISKLGSADSVEAGPGFSLLKA